MLYKELKITDIIRINPVTARVFYKEKFDICHEGQETLEKSCVKNHKSLTRIIKELEKSKNYSDVIIPRIKKDATVLEVIDIIINKFHEPLKKEMEDIEKLTIKVAHLHGGDYSELLILKTFIFQLFQDLKEHMHTEESILFPTIRNLERGYLDNFYKGKMSEPIWEMELEHDNHLGLLRKMRWMTNNYSLPADASNSYKALFVSLNKLEFDLNQHIYLENNFVHPRVLKL